MPIEIKARVAHSTFYSERQLIEANLGLAAYESGEPFYVEIDAEERLDYQIASPGDHRLNHAERAIQTFKNHFIAVLYGCDSTFPAKQWDRIIKQAVMTLNMCRPSQINLKLSA
jgi:hypothetical protein